MRARISGSSRISPSAWAEKWNYKHVGEVFTEMASLMPALDNITWERVEREDHVTYPVDGPDVPGRDVVFDKGFPRPNGIGQAGGGEDTRRRTRCRTPNIPFILTTGRQLEHWHTGAMTRRATVLDALEPSAVRFALARHNSRSSASSPATWCASRRARRRSNSAARQDDGMPDGVVFIPFAFVEAAANILTNPALDPFGKIPEFKFCAAKVEARARERSGGVASGGGIRLVAVITIPGCRGVVCPTPAVLPVCEKCCSTWRGVNSAGLRL